MSERVCEDDRLDERGRVKAERLVLYLDVYGGPVEHAMARELLALRAERERFARVVEAHRRNMAMAAKIADTPPGRFIAEQLRLHDDGALDALDGGDQ